ncbi:UvrD-helicase domain-containing protein [Brevundimonas sp.]|uniref:UvrD-helicase domain-containing protein n=1 Tax=Brevundimonas sp. TaxID=1871086 RepID=UPI002EDAE7C5
MAKPKIDTIIIDEVALNALGAAAFENSWFDDFGWPKDDRVRRITLGSRAYFLSRNADESSRLLVINAGGDMNVFAGTDNKQQVLDRLIHMALSRFERTISIPVNWHVYHQESKLSVYRSIRSARDDDRRLYFDQHPEDTDHVFAFACSESRDFSEVPPRIEMFRHAIGGYIEALLSDAGEAPDNGAYGVTLTAPSGTAIVGSGDLQDWYDHKLTTQQRTFVDKPYRDPVRLKGAAGTGKTLSMAVKLLRDAYAAEDRGTPTKFAFLTHSAAVAHETVPEMLDALDRTGRWRRLRSASIFIGSIYELAQDILQYDQKKLKPISTDGKDGREYQSAEVVSATARLLDRPQFQIRDIAACSESIRDGIKNLTDRPRFHAALMNEIACVLDAENIRLGSNAASRYLTSSRERWQIDLPTEADRLAILKIHDEYRKEVEKSDYLSMDQMVADFNRYLEMHEWAMLRDKRGFDVVFVDELHYFNRVERMIFHNLFTREANLDGKMPLMMSYDLKQGPTDSFLGSGSGESAATFFQKLGTGESKLVELTEVFRSTPEITRFINDLDAAFPALDLEGEWGVYEGASARPNGDQPTLRLYEDSKSLLDGVFKAALKDAASFGGKNVAVICMNEDLYSRYLKVGRIADKFVELSARDQTAELRYAGKRCVFTMPEYVAGLQFDSVHVIHADRAELDDGATIGERRRFISRLYLAVSRARSQLSIASALDRGGYTSALENPIQRASLLLSN